jgi:hypothetical protein
LWSEDGCWRKARWAWRGGRFSVGGVGACGRRRSVAKVITPGSRGFTVMRNEANGVGTTAGTVVREGIVFWRRRGMTYWAGRVARRRNNR